MLAAMERGRAPDLRGASLAGTRLFVPETFVLQDCDADPLAAFEDAVARMARAGANIVRGPAPEIAEAAALAPALFAPEAYATWEHQIEANPGVMFAPVRDRFRGGRGIPATENIRAWAELARLRGVWAARVAGHDAALVPSSAILPPDAARLLADPDYFTAANLRALRNTRIGNLLGISALTLPTGTPMCGISLFGRANGEEHLLRLGAAAERALG
jgi:aspartyl-tRNA(Asn)/glutamyl-tRNA(Gln) amidotransferase subunit A